MKIAVTYENGQVFQHFGHCENFKIYDVNDGMITDSQVVSAAGSGHGALAGFLKDRGVDTLICGASVVAQERLWVRAESNFIRALPGMRTKM